jgi:hypothetical protein
VLHYSPPSPGWALWLATSAWALLALLITVLALLQLRST